MKKIIQILIFIPLFGNGQDTLTLYDALSIGLQENFNIQISKKKSRDQ